MTLFDTERWNLNRTTNAWCSQHQKTKCVAFRCCHVNHKPRAINRNEIGVLCIGKKKSQQQIWTSTIFSLISGSRKVLRIIPKFYYFFSLSALEVISFVSTLSWKNTVQSNRDRANNASLCGEILCCSSDVSAASGDVSVTRHTSNMKPRYDVTCQHSDDWHSGNLKEHSNQTCGDSAKKRRLMSRPSSNGAGRHIRGNGANSGSLLAVTRRKKENISKPAQVSLSSSSCSSAC